MYIRSRHRYQVINIINAASYQCITALINILSVAVHLTECAASLPQSTATTIAESQELTSPFCGSYAQRTAGGGVRAVGTEAAGESGQSDSTHTLGHSQLIIQNQMHWSCCTSTTPPTDTVKRPARALPASP